MVTKDNLSCRKMASILGQVRSFLVALPFLRAFTDTMCQLVNISTQKGWNHQQKVPSNLKDQLKEIKIVLDNWGETLFIKPPTRIALRFFNSGMGRFRPQKWIVCKRFLETRFNLAHKCKGASSGYTYCSKLGKGKPNSFVVSGQPGNIFLPTQRGGGRVT